jgi:hypothetical protein
MSFMANSMMKSVINTSRDIKASGIWGSKLPGRGGRPSSKTRRKAQRDARRKNR